MKQTAYINRLHPDDGHIPVYPSTMMSHERRVRENYEFLKKRVREAPVTPMMPSVWDRVVARIAVSLTTVPRAAELMQQIKEEAATDYESSLRKFMG